MSTENASPLSPEERVQHEARLRPRQTTVATVTGVLFVIAAALQLSGPQAKVGELTVQLLVIHKRFPLDIVGGVVQGLALLGLAWTLSFLFDCARARRPEMASATRYAALAGAAVSAVGGVIYATILAIKANDFAGSGSQTYPEAHHLTSGSALPVLYTLDIVAHFALEIGLILIALNAMRVGLLTRFIGYCGIVVGIAGMLLIGSPPAAALQIFWLGALAVLLSGRWQGGDPPAWRTGRAEPWPSSAAMREQRMAAGAARSARGGRNGPMKPTPTPQPAGGPAPAEDSAPVRTRSTTSKRKRKRRG